MSPIKALIAAGALALVAAPTFAFAHGDDDDDDGGVSFGLYFGSPGWYGPAYEPAYAVPAYYPYRHYYRRYHYRRYRVLSYAPRRYYYYRRAYVTHYAPCHWITNRYYERSGDYVVRHERICR